MTVSTLPQCPYGVTCYRKNVQHRLDFSHTSIVDVSRKPANKPKSKAPKIKHGGGISDSGESENDEDRGPKKCMGSISQHK